MHKDARPAPPKAPPRRGRPFRRASAILAARVQSVAERQGFAKREILTRWAEIAGPSLAEKATPLRLTYARGGMGATLLVHAQGAVAHEVELQAPLLRERLNAVFGYNAVARVKITQAGARTSGFAEGQAGFAPAPAAAPQPVKPPLSETTKRAAAAMTEGVLDGPLRAALATLAQNALSRPPR